MRELDSFQKKQLDKAGALAQAQLEMAIDIVNTVLKNDQRLLDGVVLGAVVQAIALNYGHVGGEGK